MDANTHYCLNGELTPAAETKIHVSDLGLLRGYGIFDFFLVEESVPLFVADYLNRFFSSAEMVRLQIPFTLDEVRDQIRRVISANQIRNAAVRLVLTGGYSPDGITPARPNLVVMTHPYPTYPAAYYREGTALITDEYQRHLPAVKTINYLNSILLQSKMKEAGAVDVLYHDNGLLSETSRSNFFLVTSDQTVVTTPGGVLPGITRMKVLELARNRYKVEERPLELSELRTAAETFITGSTKKVMPIVRIDDQPVGDGKIGPVTQSLMSAFADYTEQYIQEHKAAVK